MLRRTSHFVILSALVVLVFLPQTTDAACFHCEKGICIPGGPGYRVCISGGPKLGYCIADATTACQFASASGVASEVQIYDVAERLVHSLALDALVTEDGSLNWDGRDLEGKKRNTGLYYYRILRGNQLGKRVPMVWSAD